MVISYYICISQLFIGNKYKYPQVQKTYVLRSLWVYLFKELRDFI
nr:MAG TPA: hypothetical protein [Caudoviricetes sp.]